MLYEFSEQYDNVLATLEHCIEIAENSRVDDIDLSVLDVDPVEVASNCFMYSGLCIPTERIALKEAYDFIVSHTRLMDLYNHDRSFYYSRAGKELQTIIDRVKHLNAALTTLALNAQPSKS